jgi:hypothetical protein
MMISVLIPGPDAGLSWSAAAKLGDFAWPAQSPARDTTIRWEDLDEPRS